MYINTHVIYYVEAVHRFYESRRQLFNDNLRSHRQRAGEVKKKCKKIVQQKKVTVHAYGTIHTLIIVHVVLQQSKEGSEESPEMWADIDYRYMTEESEGENDSINRHKLTWRSRG